MIKLKDDDCMEHISSGLFRSSGKWIHPERVCNTHVLIFVLSGTVCLFEEDTRYELHENDIILLEQGKCHGGYEVTEEAVSYYWVHFRTGTNLTFKTLSVENSNSVKTMFSQLMHFTNTPGYSDNASDIVCSLIMEEILFESKQVEMVGSKLAVELKEYIRLNIEKNISVADVAAKFGYHENYIGKVFKNFYGVNMKKYITELIIKRTQDYLLTTLYTVKEIAYMNGFKSENHFIKFFKYHLNITPTEYRNIYINTHINNK